MIASHLRIADPAEATRITQLAYVTIGVMFLAALTLVALDETRDPFIVLICALACAGLGGLIWLIRIGQVRLVTVCILVITWAALTVWIWPVAGGLAADYTVVGYGLFITLAGLFWNEKAALAATAVTGITIAAGELSLPHPASTFTIGMVIVVMSVLGISTSYAIRTMLRALAELRHANARLQAIDEQRRRFVGVASHDLKAPLHSVRTAAELLLVTDLPPDAQRTYLQGITETADRAAQLVTRLLDLNRLEAGMMPVNRAVVSLPALIHGALAEIGPNHLDVTAVEDVSAWADAGLLTQVIINLVDNAIRYSPPGAPIRLAARRSNSEITVSVSDNGPGIPPDERESIFQPFQRSSATKNNSRGTGLGLSICREIVHLHGGRIWVESQPGQGSAFRFTLPATGGRNARNHH